jgi:outer membrane receptor protein involved in Fe transport
LTQNDFYGDAEYMVPLTSDSKLRFRLEDTYFGDRGIQQSVYDVPTTFINSSGDLPPGTSLVLDLAGHTHGPEYALGGYWTDARSALRVLNNQATVPRGFGGPMSEFLTEVQWDWAWPENNYFLAGGNFTYDQSGQNCYTSSEVSDKNYAAYLQDEYHLWEQIVLLAGLRYDFNTAYGSNLSPRGSVVYSPLPEWRFKALYGTAFRAPMFWERYANDMPMGGFFIGRGNSELKPEKVDQAEASAEYFIGNWAQLKGDYFYWETQDEIQAYSVQSYPYYLYAPDLSQVNSALPAQPGLVAFNQGGIMSISNDNSRIGKGFELEATARPITYMKIQLNYAHFNMYSRKTSVYMFIDQGDEDILNAMVGFNYKGLFFINFYGHMAKTPKTIIDYTNPEIFNSRTIWLNQFDITLGGKIRGVDLALTIFNFMENAVAFDQVKDAYLKGPKILRLTAAYNLAF